ncbi:unnamed protein product, partial [marine sediment metagenome]
TILGQRRRPAEREYRELMSSGDVHVGFKGFARDWLGWVFALLLIGGPLTGYFLTNRYIEQSVATQTRAERNHKVARFKAQQTIQVERFEYEERGTLEGPQYTSFEFLEDTRYFDLRNWRPPRDKNANHYSPVTMIRETRVRKIRPEDYIRIQAMTSGTNVYLSSRREKDRYAVPDLERVGKQDLKVREIVLDLADVGVGDEETLVVNVTYYEAFQTPDQWWAGVTVKEQISRVGLVVVFPEDRPFLSLECLRVQGEKEEKGEFC